MGCEWTCVRMWGVDVCGGAGGGCEWTFVGCGRVWVVGYGADMGHVCGRVGVSMGVQMCVVCMDVRGVDGCGLCVVDVYAADVDVSVDICADVWGCGVPMGCGRVLGGLQTWVWWGVDVCGCDGLRVVDVRGCGTDVNVYVGVSMGVMVQMWVVWTCVWIRCRCGS